MAHLFPIDFLSYKSLKICILCLLKNAETINSRLFVEFSVSLLKAVGPFIPFKPSVNDSKLDEYVQYLEKFKEIVSSEVKAMICDLENLQADGWLFRL